MESLITKNKRREEVREMAMTSAQALRKEGRKEGALHERREAVLETISARFQTVPSSISEKIKTIKSMVRLKRIFSQCLTVDSLDEIEI